MGDFMNGSPENAKTSVDPMELNGNEDFGLPKKDINGTTPVIAEAPFGPSKGQYNKDVESQREWFSRGYLPHRNRPHLIQSVTFRLADSLPLENLEKLKQELTRLPVGKRELEARKRMEAWLDAGMGCCALRHPEIAQWVQNSLLFFHLRKYYLHAWCIMPNHVHILVEPIAELSRIIQGWKSFTARWILRQNTRLGLRIPEENRLWMRDYWDRYIRDPGHYQKTVEYIHQNPVKAGLCLSPMGWPWSSYGRNPDEIHGGSTIAPSD